MKEISEKKSETENEVLHSAQTLIEPSIFYRFDSTGFNAEHSPPTSLINSERILA
jgi:hypothetical protein